MPNITLKDILIGARQEAHRMRHFYLGAEHLLIALLEIKGSLACRIVQEYGLTPEYVIDAIRRKVGKGSKHRLWAGIPNTPRADVILSIANDLALESGRDEINERDLLIALFEENDSIPLRVLKALGLDDMNKLSEMARAHILNNDSEHPYVKIDFGIHFDRQDMLAKDHLFILRRMFYGYSEIRVERRLTGGYSNATLLIVTPIHIDRREDAPVVVKINHADDILDEAQRYESHVKSKLPAMTARLEDKPVAPETSDLAGIKYTLVAGYNQIPQDLRAVIHEWNDSRKLGSWLRHELFPVFGRIWWQQNRPYRFQVWREYDWMLPPILTLELVKDAESSPDTRVLSVPMKRSKLQGIEYGDLVLVQNFIVQKVSRVQNTIHLAIGHGTESANAYKIEVRGVDMALDTYYRGEVIENLVGRVYKTRQEQLLHAVRALDPDFDPQAEKIFFQSGAVEKLPNPVFAYEELLDHYVNGTLSTIHGDLHPGNIMIGPNQSAFLIDFAHTREGHTIFDWATLETSLLSDVVMSKVGSSWDDARYVLQYVSRLDRENDWADADSPISETMASIIEIRHIVRECLAYPDRWGEYYIALLFCGLRAVTWETMSLAGRRLMFLIAALSAHELQTRFSQSGSGGETPSPDETDVNTISG